MNCRLEVAAAVGVPLSTPAVVKVMPLGKPVTDQVYVPVPPVAEKVTAGYVVPTVPGDSDEGLAIVSGTGVSRRMRLSCLSATYILPAESRLRVCGPLNVALRAGPPSPNDAPPPAMVVMVPPETLRITLFKVSAI